MRIGWLLMLWIWLFCDCRDLKLCMECGGVMRILCVRCKVCGILNESIFFFDGSSKFIICFVCRGKGNFLCFCCFGNKFIFFFLLVCFGWRLWGVVLYCLVSEDVVFIVFLEKSDFWCVCLWLFFLLFLYFFVVIMGWIVIL